MSLKHTIWLLGKTGLHKIHELTYCFSKQTLTEKEVFMQEGSMKRVISGQETSREFFSIKVLQVILKVIGVTRMLVLSIEQIQH